VQLHLAVELVRHEPGVLVEHGNGAFIARGFEGEYPHVKIVVCLGARADLFACRLRAFLPLPGGSFRIPRPLTGPVCAVRPGISIAISHLEEFDAERARA